MIKRSRGGQFYLVAAIVLASVLIGIVSISNYIGQGADSRILETKEEIAIEVSSVIENSISNSQSDADFRTRMLDFTEKYSEEIKSNYDSYFLFGTSTGITVSGYQREVKEVILEGTANTTITDEGGSFSSDSINPGDSSVNLWIGGMSQDFELTSSRNAYFILYEELNSGEYFVKW